MDTPILQDALHAVGVQAGQIVDLWRFTLLLTTVVFALVLAAFAWALMRAPRGRLDEAPVHQPPGAGTRRVVVGGVALSVAGLLALIVASVATDRALARMDLHGALHVELTGNQWWWSARYDDADVSRVFTTANELHLPVGRPVILTLRSNDVIHSFWVPNLVGKKDLIPGRTAQLQLRADRPGTYRGQCAEFCGLQHAWMALHVVAEAPADYERWAERQRAGAPEPAGAQLARGRDLFLGGTCVMCHAVQGTAANARRAPDLTHVGGRAFIGAGALANTPDNLARWIADPQAVKPGSNMPANALAPDDLKAIAAWLGSLK